MKSLCSERNCTFIVLVCFITDCEIFRLFLHYTSMLLHNSIFRKVYMKLVQENGIDSLFLSANYMFVRGLLEQSYPCQEDGRLTTTLSPSIDFSLCPPPQSSHFSSPASCMYMNIRKQWLLFSPTNYISEETLAPEVSLSKNAQYSDISVSNSIFIFLCCLKILFLTFVLVVNLEVRVKLKYHTLVSGVARCSAAWDE